MAGISVLLLEKEVMPRIKPCGGALTHRALNLLPAGSDPYLKEHPRQWTFQGARASAVTLSRDTPYCHIVERQYFDQFLAESAGRAGAVVHDHESVTEVQSTNDGVVVVTSHGRYQADYVIAADGAHGPVAKMMGFPRPRRGAAIEAEVPADKELWERYAGRVEIHIGQYPWGYAWVIPRDGMLNIGVGSFRAQRLPLKQRFYDFAEQIVHTRAINPLAHPLPYRLRFQAPRADRVLFAGDAAGFMDAFSAEGIYSALSSGQLAAETIRDAVTNNDSLDHYAARLHQEVWPSLRAAVKLGLLFYPLAGFWSEFFVRNQSLLSDYLDVAMGQLPYRVLQKHTERAFLAERGIFAARSR